MGHAAELVETFIYLSRFACPEIHRLRVCYLRLAGKEVKYAGTQPAGYAAEPVETVNYTSCHDGEILFDQLIMKPEEKASCQTGRDSTLAWCVETGVSSVHQWRFA